MLKSKRVCGIMLVLSLFFLVFGGIFTLHKNDPQEASAASATAEIKIKAFPVRFVNNGNVAVDVLTMPTATHDAREFITGKWSQLSPSKDGNSYIRVNEKIAGLSSDLAPLLEFKKTKPDVIDETSRPGNTGYLKWDYQNSTSVTGPYKLETIVSVISYNGKYYMPLFKLGFSTEYIIKYGSIFATELIEVTAGATVNITTLEPKLIDENMQFGIPMGEAIFKDDQGRIFIYSGVGGTDKYYFTFSNGKPGFTNDLTDPGLVKTESKVPEDATAQVTQWENMDYNPNGTYDGETNQCPVQDNDYWTVTGDTSTEAGRHTALVTPKNGMTWSDGTTEGKIITWTVGKANQPDTLAVTGGENVKYGDKPTLTVDGVEGGAKVTWSVSPAELADIDPTTGELTPKGVGEVTVTATVGEINNYNGTSVTQKSHD